MQAHRVVMVGGGAGGLKLACKQGLQVQGIGVTLLKALALHLPMDITILAWHHQTCMTLHHPSKPIGALRNQLLAALPAEDLKHWLTNLKAVNLPLGQVVYESGTPVKCGYFPIDAFVSILFVLENGASAEIAVLGDGGVVGSRTNRRCLPPSLRFGFGVTLPTPQRTV